MTVFIDWRKLIVPTMKNKRKHSKAAMFLLGLIFLACWDDRSVADIFGKVAELNPGRDRKVQIMAFRGMRGSAPENTRPALEKVIDDGMDWVWVDVRSTSDGIPVLFAGDALEEKSSGSGMLSQKTFEEIAALDAGEWFAERFRGIHLLPLSEALGIIRNKIGLCMDCRGVDAEKVLEMIRTSGVEDQVLLSGTPEFLAEIRNLSNGQIATLTEKSIEQMEQPVEENAVKISIRGFHPDQVKKIKGTGAQVVVDTREEDEPVSWQKAIESGASCILTDRPELALACLIHREMTVPPVKWSLHRGAGLYAPENTLPAFSLAAQFKADFIEFDVRKTREGDYFLLHDSKLNRTTNGQGPISEASTPLVATLDAGSWFSPQFKGEHVPTLDQFLENVPDGIELYFDAKDISPADLLKALEKYSLVSRTVVYQSAEYLSELHHLNPEIRVMPPLPDHGELEKVIAELKPYAFDAGWRDLSAEVIQNCHQLGVKVFADSLGPFEQTQEYLKAIRWGIDLIQTDQPLKLLQAMEIAFKENKERLDPSGSIKK